MNILIVAIALAFVAVAQAKVSPHEVLLAEWNEFKITHGRVYENSEHEEHSFQIYLANRKAISKHNHAYLLGLKTYKQEIGRFADLSRDELVAKYTGLKKNKQNSRSWPVFNRTIDIADVPSSFDWRPKGAVTHVKDQGQCGSCWAFSTTGALEGAHFVKTGKLVSLSEQQLVDCSTKNAGCNGGLMDWANEYIIDNKGIEAEDSYPYHARQSKTCHFNASLVAATESKYVRIPKEDEVALMNAVATVGPITVAIQVLDSFQHYSGGVYFDDECSPDDDDSDHAVLVVGYGTDPIYGDYWIVKNSWAKVWGEAGYIRMARNKDNMCGIATGAMYPVV